MNTDFSGAMPFHSDYSNIVSLVEYLAEMGWSGREIAHVVAKPGAYSDEYELMVAGLACCETEPGL